MIKETKTYSVVCDKCGLQLKRTAESRRVARDLAKDKGWRTIVRLSGEYHYCPVCGREFIAEEEYYGG